MYRVLLERAAEKDLASKVRALWSDECFCLRRASNTLPSN